MDAHQDLRAVGELDVLRAAADVRRVHLELNPEDVRRTFGEVTEIEDDKAVVTAERRPVAEPSN